MKLIKYEKSSGFVNMQTDEDLLNEAIENNSTEPIFRFYGWEPYCVSLGRNQSDKFVNYEFLKSQNIDVVRRMTGGRALLHAEELTYSCVYPVKALKNGESVINSFKEISNLWVEVFKTFGIELDYGNKKPDTLYDYCMLVSTGADLCYQGKKLIGSAQCRRNNYIMQHGSILLRYDRIARKDFW